VRWANEDPNPTAQQKGTDELEERVRLAVLAKMQEDPQYPDMSGFQSGDAYPNTNEQYLTYTGEEQPALSLVPYEETSDPTTTTATPTPSYYPAITPPPGLGGSASASSAESAPVSLPPGLAQQPSEQKQQEYTKEQWKAWYLYYYGYVPPEFDAEPTSDDPSLSSPASAEQVAEEGKDQKDASDDEEKEKESEGEKETQETKKRKVLA